MTKTEPCTLAPGCSTRNWIGSGMPTQSFNLVEPKTALAAKLAGTAPASPATPGTTDAGGPTWW